MQLPRPLRRRAPDAPVGAPAGRRERRRAHEWAVDVEVREDEPSTWIPTTHLPAAAVGDGVTVRSSHLAAARHGTVVETLEDETRGRFHRVAFQPD